MRALVTGGGGFLGSAIVRALAARGDEVVSLARGAYPELAAIGIACVRADLADSKALERACNGADVVFHVAAKAGVWGAREAYERTNVEGTRNVIEACKRANVRRLVFTSSPSVCFDGRDQVMASNDLPYAPRFLAPYPETKARAEELVLAANGDGLATCALRPHLIFGTGDPHLLPRIVQRARVGKLAIVGRGDNEVTLTYIDNAVHAHLRAADELDARSHHAGKAYFIGQEHPVVLWTWIGALLEELGIARPRRRVPLMVAYASGAVFETAWRAFALAGEPPMTRFLALQLARSHSYDMQPARRDFGYREQVALDVATERTLDDLRARARV